MNSQRLHRANLLALATASGLSACGGGGAGMVRDTIPTGPSPVPAPVQPSPRSLQLPVAPAAKTVPSPPAYDDINSAAFAQLLDSERMNIGDGFVFDPVSGIYKVSLPITYRPPVLNARTPGSLTKEGAGDLYVAGRFDGGIHVDAGRMLLYTDVLHSNIVIAPGAGVEMEWGDIVGNVDNHGTLALDDFSEYYDQYTDLDIFGDYSQHASATMAVRLASQKEGPVHPKLSVSGRATLDGTLEFRNSYYVPSGGYLDWVLYARGGVFGQFARWTSPGKLINGTLHYDSNNVWLELTRVSVQSAMISAGTGNPLTLASAAHLDQALAGADAFASLAPASLNNAQARFLQSAGQLLWVSDPQQAAHSLDSLAGSLHVDALQYMSQGSAMSTAMAQHLLTLQPGTQAGSWSRREAESTVAGYDQWLGPRLLLGTSTSLGNPALAAHSRDHESQAALYLRWFNDNGWYAGGSAGFARHELSLDRPIDLGPGGRLNAHSHRGVDVVAIDTEVGRRFSVAGGVLAPYTMLGADVLRSERALEQGATGFELALQANTQARLTAGIGLRYGKRWQFGEGAWLQLDADAHAQRGLADAGSPLQAAFIGVPDVGFALVGSQVATTGWSDIGLRGGFARGWIWTLGHTGSFARPNPERRWLLGLQRGF